MVNVYEIQNLIQFSKGYSFILFSSRNMQGRGMYVSMDGKNIFVFLFEGINV